jgi:hypothetical protein
MKPTFLAAAFAVVFLLALWVVPRGCDNRGANAPYSEGWQATADTLQRKLAALEAELAEERHARQLLASDIELLREMLGEAAGEITLAALAAGMEGDVAQDEFAEDRTDSDLESPGDQTDGELIAAGVDEFEAERVRAVWHEIHLEKLELRDLATREGWVKSKRFRKELEKIQEDALDELGECGYDSLLYGTGQNNRIVVREMLEGSAADRAGLEPGDTLLRYDENRVWAVSDLQAATTLGERGESVIVDIERAGEKMYFRVDRGPFGIFLRPERGAPDGC